MTATGAAALSAVAGCDSQVAGAERPTAVVYILVDLSETWHNATYARRNQAALAEVGLGVAAATEAFEPPIAVQHRIIGQGSLEREPICDVVYRPTLVQTRKSAPNYLITRPDKLMRYLGTDCPREVLSRPAEPLTEISSALASVASQPDPPQAKRFLIILSDFLEDAGATTHLPAADLRRFRVLMLFRPLLEDQRDPTALAARVEGWRRALEAAGARVKSMPDTALKRSTIAAYLTEK